MRMDTAVKKRIIRNALLSLFIYALPLVLMFVWFFLRGEVPLNYPAPAIHRTGLFWALCDLLNGNGFVVFIVGLGLAEFMLGRYGDEWRGNETVLDIVCFALPRLVFAPFFAWFSLKVLPFIAPREHNLFNWVPFFWGILILCVADDLTQYWYHRLHHEIPWLWRFHRTHHSAPYMGMSMASRQNAIYSIFFSQTYVTSILVYLGLGPASIAILTIKSLITTLAHSSIPWDKPLYESRLLHPIAWVLERTISTPATHHAHHAAATDDGIGYYKGNFGNMFFLWDVIFGTAHISRRYPKAYGISHYRGDPWYAQVLWPVFKSNIPGSELAPDGPMVRTDEYLQSDSTNAAATVAVTSGGD
jgi:sterol desaturase/sphingolipid hydroxylase (fatty acid hydroxylase superfamily)